jgi:hypothetical protein
MQTPTFYSPPVVPMAYHSPPVVPIPLVVVLWERRGYGGVKRALVQDTSDLGPWNFDERTHSIGVHPGPDFAQWAPRFPPTGPTVTFASADPNDGKLTLAAGAYSDLDEFSWGGRIHSVTFNYDSHAQRPTGGWNPKTGQGFQLTGSGITAIPFIPFVVDLWTGYSSYPEPEGYPPGTRLTLVESSYNLADQFGDEFADGVGTVQVQRGPNYSGYDVVRLCRYDNYNGEYVEYGPDGGIIPSGSADTHSVVFTQPPRNPPLVLSVDKFADLVLSVLGAH